MARSLHLLLVTLSVVLLLSGPAAAQGFGSRLLRTFFVFAEQPLSSSVAEANGWSRLSSTCDPDVGYAYAQSPSGPTSLSPVTLYYTAAGQLSGFGVRVSGKIEQNLVNHGFWRRVAGQSDTYDIYIRTRDAKFMCSGAKSLDVIGDRLEINSFFTVPLNQSVAVKQGWAPGNCIGRMGIHHSFDLAAFGGNSWNASTLVPVQPMYDAQRHTINAILFNMPHAEYTEPIGMFEGPFTNGLFCKNWCADSGCTFDIGFHLWSTMHFHFVDPSTISCTGSPCVL
ncbi:uncharacterized protein ACA1_215700 [Acanthamoeba castellanii str. Neff]|uniref:Uncharacterized protein n=1 Tax=Acanthamoeba castellanii (strain ATCC 30010 / Neff) TaxID=1257118 RepID=L8GR37_ACACF|nr:uncharacterized protein ACA1_215700 [Acanthamoeba castellanii str. Neff]ELR15098.1 hypothetical protein ACA1_215700 [Acanthamoeba castellanii str. Neff]